MGLLRLLLALSVVASHGNAIFTLEMVGRQISVQTFFILSGFYITMILNEKYVGKNKSYLLFISNRLMRLYPVYWCILILELVSCFIIYFKSNGLEFHIIGFYLENKPSILSIIFLVFSNIFIFLKDLVPFLAFDNSSGNLFFTINNAIYLTKVDSFQAIPQGWSLGVELMFYLIAPFLVTKKPKIILVIICTSLVLRCHLYNVLHLQYDPWLNRFFPTEMALFLSGYFSYQLYKYLKKIKYNQKINLFFYIIIFIFTFFYQWIPAYKCSLLPFSFKEIIYFFTIIIGIPFLFNSLKSNYLDMLLGNLSYPIYISHILIINICNVIPFELFKNNIVKTLVLLVNAYLLHKWVEIPVEKFRQSRLKI